MLQYQTDLKIPAKPEDSSKDLLSEVDDIWPSLRVDAEKGNYTSAIISAREVPRGLIFKQARGYNFVYEKGPDKSWHRLKNQ